MIEPADSLSALEPNALPMDRDAEVMSSIDKQVYTPEEVGRMLGLHPNSIYSMLQRGDLPGFKARHKWLISKKRFEAWLDGGET